MARVVITEDADADIAEILTYLTEVAGARVAEKYDAQFKAVYARLAAFPGIGAPRPELGENRRIITVAPYLIIYEEIEPDTVLILRIVYARRQITSAIIGD